MGSLAKVGLAFDGRAPTATLFEHAKAADAVGADSLWIANHLFERDPFSAAAVTLAATCRPRIALMGVSPYTPHPVQAVMTAATLDELFPGRVALCFGVGSPQGLASAGVEPRRPLQTLKESLEIARALLAGERLTYAGEIFQVNGRALATGARPVRLLLAATGPQMLALAGAAADGVGSRLAPPPSSFAGPWARFTMLRVVALWSAFRSSTRPSPTTSTTRSTGSGGGWPSHFAVRISGETCNPAES